MQFHCKFEWTRAKRDRFEEKLKQCNSKKKHDGNDQKSEACTASSNVAVVVAGNRQLCCSCRCTRASSWCGVSSVIGFGNGGVVVLSANGGSWTRRGAKSCGTTTKPGRRRGGTGECSTTTRRFGRRRASILGDKLQVFFYSLISS